ncbi:MAG: protein kinase [Deltaproteobacteria bacterium]|nr:protein kinase [Deltaproteobacteria bacterium]
MTDRDSASPPDDAGATTSRAQSTPGEAPGPNDPTRTRAPDAHVARPDAGTEGPGRSDRLPAPLQYRDPERYQIVGEHGRGGLGRVLRARDKELGRDVAVKELLERGNTSELRFFREALITARLEHPGIVPVHEAGRWPDGTPFYAMKLVQGRPLRECIDDCTTIEQRLALLPHVIAVTDAIAYAHDRKIIHRDLKPANIIVGDFGETVVIDWGLAKDISLEIPDPVGAESTVTTAAPDGLTVAGSMLGTPAYMAPEQREGRADERSDVYAIGGILLHLLTGSVPSADEPGRSSTDLRSIPRDLAAIIVRARHPSPEQRYASVGALGDDLRAYSRRTPVSARRYSLTARALLGFARHRAASIVLITALSALSIVLLAANHRISGEREHAVTAETSAEQSRSETQDALNALVLEHANVLLATDPSAAIDAIDKYRGNDEAAVRKLRARAKGLGVAVVRASPNVGTIFWLQVLPGKVITIGIDGIVAATYLSGEVRVLANNAAWSSPVAYADRNELLAYGCRTHDVCFFDLVSERPRSETIRNEAPTALALSPSGSHLAIVSDEKLSLWRLSGGAASCIARSRLDATDSLMFIDDDHLAVRSSLGVVAVLNGDTVQRVNSARVTAWSRASRRPRLAVGTADGDIEIVSTAHVSPDRYHVCDGAVASIALFSDGSHAAYGCQDGAVGTFDFARRYREPRVHLRDTPAGLSLSWDEQLLVTGASGDGVVAIDLEKNTLQSLLGHRTKVTNIAAPSIGLAMIASSDESGNLRIWEPPLRALQILPEHEADYYDVCYLADSSEFAASSSAPFLQVFSAGAHRRVAPHQPLAANLIRSMDRSRFVAFGPSGIVEVWDASPVSLLRTIATEQGSMAWADFMPDNTTVVTAAQDGRVTLWPADAPPVTITDLHRELAGMMVVYPSGELVVVTSDGALWRVQSGRRDYLIDSAGAGITTFDRSDDTRWMTFGDTDGKVRIVDTSTWQVRTIFNAHSGISDLEFSPANDRLAIATHDDGIHLAHDESKDWTTATWMTFSEQATYLAYSPDGDFLFAACGEAGAWFLSLDSPALANIPTTPAILFRTRIAPDGSTVLALDRSGRLIRIDVAKIRSRLNSENGRVIQKPRMTLP